MSRRGRWGLHWIAVAIAGLMVVALSACSPHSRTAAPTSGAPIALPIDAVQASAMPPEMQRVGIDSGIELPRGWHVDRSGAQRAGRYVALSATRTSNRSYTSNSTVIIDTSHRQAWVYPQVHDGWYSGSATIVGDWFLHEEKAQLSDGDCTSVAAYDCFRWTVYAQRIGRRELHLLGQSIRPGSQRDSPILHEYAGSAFWLEGEGSGRFRLRSWSPAMRAPRTLASHVAFGTVVPDAEPVLVVPPTRPRSATNTVYPITATGIANPRGEFEGYPTCAVRSNAILYLGAGTGGTEWRLGRLRPSAAQTGSSSSLIGIPGSDAVAAAFLGSSHAYVLSDLTMSLIDLRKRSVTTVPLSDSVSIPRASDNYLTMVHQSGTGRAVIGWRLFA